MTFRVFGSVCLVLLATTRLGLAQVGVFPERTTDWGDPDLQGVWDFRTITPMERPTEFFGKRVLTEEEAAGYEAEENRRQNRDLVDPLKGGAIYPPESEGGVVPYNEFWYDRGSSLSEGRRTSLIVEPPNGRIPEVLADVDKQGRAVSADVEGRRPVRFRSGELEQFVTAGESIWINGEKIHIDALYSLVSELNQGKITLENLQIK